MLVTQQPAFRDFWYPVMPLSMLKKGPQPFTLLGEKLVLWLDKAHAPQAIEDRCCHRSAALSRGWVDGDSVVCPYHGWAFAGTGQCVKIPQQTSERVGKGVRVRTFHAQEKYGYAWVCLGNPRRAIPTFPEATSPNYRSFPCFYETWNTTSLRVIENELDMSHFAVVHRGTFGDPTVPLPLSFQLDDIDAFTLKVSANLSVRPRGDQKKNTRENKEVSTRFMEITWHLPFTIRLAITYPTGLHHVIINHPTPIADNQIQVVQFCFRNDTDADASQEQVLAFERLILDEDRHVLETTDPDVPLRPNEVMHLMTDRPGLLARKKIEAALRSEAIEVAPRSDSALDMAVA